MSKEKSRSYKIVEVTKDNNRLIVDARFYESGKEVGRINHGFPIELSDKKIESEIKKACATFFADKEIAVVEKVKAEKDKKAQAKIDNLVGKQAKV
jgi:hypothetical protein